MGNQRYNGFPYYGREEFIMGKNEKRRDKKGRVLRQNEQQRADGRYMFVYDDALGQRHYVYSWKLEPTDKAPAGKKSDKSLRELEKEIAEELHDGIAPVDMTVYELAEKYINLRLNSVRESTKRQYRTVLNNLKKQSFSKKKINEISKYDAKAYLVELQNAGVRYSSLHNIRGVLRPAFRMAEDNDWIRKNPFDFEFSEVVVNDMITREALDRDTQKRFMDFVKNDNHYNRYYDCFYILIHTGLRISEWCGITIEDIDLVEGTLNVNKQLQRTSDMRYIIVETKTNAGIRVLPLEDGVIEAFKRILDKRPKYGKEPVVKGSDGKEYKGFLYLDKNNLPLVAQHWEKHMQLAVQKHNRIYKNELPSITPHILRHTFCTNCARSGMNPKTLQYLMGHSDIGVTLNTYTHLKYEDAKEEMNRLKKELNKENED